MSKRIFYLILYIYVISETASQKQPQITDITPARTQIGRGSAEFSCHVKDTDGYNVLWKRTDDNPDSNAELISTNTTLNTSNTRLSVNFNSTASAFILNINDVQLSDGGDYICEIPLDKDHNIKQQTRLEFLTRPFFYDNSTVAEIAVSEGSDVTIECYAGGLPVPVVTIMRDNDALLRGGRVDYVGSVLKIEKIKKIEGGRYRCAANMSGAITSRYVSIEVQTVPLIQSCRLNVLYYPEFNAAFECILESYVEPNISWYRNNEQLKDNSNFVTNVISTGKLSTVTLKINNTNTAEYGRYSVKAVNPFGERETTIGILSDSAIGSCLETSCTTQNTIIVIFLIIPFIVVGWLYYVKKNRRFR